MMAALSQHSFRSRRGAGAALLAAVVVGIVVWTATAGADVPRKPAALAHKAKLTMSAKALDAPPSASALVGTNYKPGQGKGGGKEAQLGDGDVIADTFAGSLVPVAVESSDGSMVAYTTWHLLADIQPGKPAQGLTPGQDYGITSVRLYDSASGKSRFTEPGARSPAISRDGRLAFFRGDTNVVKVDEPYVGKLVVGSLKSGGFAEWTSESGRYFPYAWSGKTLLVYQQLSESEATDVYAYTGPDARRLIAAHAFIIALSPDGTRVLVTVDRRLVEVIRLADGAVLSTLELDGNGIAPDAPGTPHYLMYSGSWRGDRVVANSDVGLVILNVAGGIRIESVMATTAFAHGLVEPRFVDDTRVIGWADIAATERIVAEHSDLAYDNALAVCDLATTSCTIGDQRPNAQWTRWVDNPSK
jgi:hypothetical protein